MLPSELKLMSLGHCFIHLPETFVSSEPTIKGGAIVSIKSIQTDNQLYVMWNGQLTSGEHIQLDLSFGQANKFQDELVIISLVDNLELSECSFCRVELLDPTDYNILSQHAEANLLDTCKLVNQDLIVPIFVSQHVKVLVKVLSFEPNQPFGLLTKWTQMNFEHNLENLPRQEKVKQDSSIKNPIPFLSCALGINYKPNFYLGSVLVCGERGSGKTYFVKNVLKDYQKYHSELFNCKQLRGKRPESVKKKFAELISNAFEKQPSIIALDDIDSFLSSDPKHEEERGQDALYKKRLVDAFCSMLKQIERQEQFKGLIVLIATCRSMESLDERISRPKGRQYFNEVIRIAIPDLQGRIDILKNIIDKQQINSSIDDEQLEKIAQRCGSSYMPSDLRRIFERALISACSRSSLDFNSDPVTIQLSDFIDSIEGYVPINLRAISLHPKTLRTFENVGGMKKIKDILIKTVLLPIRYPKLYRRCPLKPQNSILLFGPPGCGKTMIAEALTNQDNINSICVRGPELLSKFIGASEAAVRDLFKRAQLARPCVIFFDEFESLVAKRGADSTGVTDRVVNQFLTILDGVDSLGHDVFIIVATSRPDMIDPAMLRPGRLDRHLYCPLPDEEDRKEILKVLSKDMDIDDSVDIVCWSSQLNGFTGADIQAFLFSAQLKALHELVGSSASIFEGNSPPASRRTKESDSSKQNLEIKVSERHLVDSFNEMKPNVDTRFVSLLKQYPPRVGQTKSQVAMRATLA